MFAKLLKHDFRSNALALSILSAAIVGMGIAAGFLVRLLTFYGADQFSDTNIETVYTMIMSGSIISLSFCMLGMIGCFAATFIILLIHFYRSRFTDRGYLTFTLPVKNHQIFMSAFLNIMIWLVIAFAALILGAAAATVIITVGTDSTPSDVIDFFWYTDTELPAAYVAVNAVNTVVSAIYTVVIAMTCITLASTWVKRNRILLAFGLYYGISQVVGILESILSIFTLFGSEQDWLYGDMTTIYNESIISTVIMILVRLGLIAGGYLLSTHLTKKKLNLS